MDQHQKQKLNVNEAFAWNVERLGEALVILSEGLFALAASAEMLARAHVEAAEIQAGDYQEEEQGRTSLSDL